MASKKKKQGFHPAIKQLIEMGAPKPKQTKSAVKAVK